MIWLALFVAVGGGGETPGPRPGPVGGTRGHAPPTNIPHTPHPSHVPLPDDQLTPDDIDALRFDTAMRGYRMSQVDAVIDRLRREIGDLDDELSRARQAGRALANTATSPGSSESSESPDDLGGTEAERA